MSTFAIKREKPAGGWRYWPFARRHEFISTLACGIIMPTRGLRDYECMHCLTYSGMSEWGLANLDRNKALCSSTKAPRITLVEWFIDAIDCSYTRTVREMK